jgi:hypothetical protein
VCANHHVMRKERIDDAVLAAIGGDVLRPAVIDTLIEGAFAALAPEAAILARDRARAELTSIEREIARLVDAVAVGGDMPAAVAAIKARQARQQALQQALAEAATSRPHLNRRTVEREVRARLTRWRTLLTTNVKDARQLLREVLAGPIRFTPATHYMLQYKFEGEAALGQLLAGIVGLGPLMASPAGFEPALPA